MIEDQPTCSVPDCGKPVLAHGLCSAHYKRRRLYGYALASKSEPLIGPPPPKKVIHKTCQADGCDMPVLALGYCKTHYHRLRRHGDANRKNVKGEPGAHLTWIKEHTKYAGDDCLIWPFTRNVAGYGQCSDPSLGRKPQIASRVMCRLAHGEPEDDAMHAAHSCGAGHEGCVNPRHLRWATPSENERDKEIHGTRLAGELAPWSKLSDADVQAIRVAQGSHQEIADRFGIARSYVSRIRSGKRRVSA